MTEQTFKRTSIWSFVLLTLVFVFLYFYDETVYRGLLKEDNIVEWLTFLFLIISGILSLILAVRFYRQHKQYHWFYIVFCFFNVLAAFEEISWGQRVFDFQTTGFFHKYSDQNETNLHNTFQGLFHIKTKHIALLAMFFYGIILPRISTINSIWARMVEKRFLMIPPKFMLTGFLLATILMFDFQTGHEEEIGELFFSICFFFLLSWQINYEGANRLQNQ